MMVVPPGQTGQNCPGSPGPTWKNAWMDPRPNKTPTQKKRKTMKKRGSDDETTKKWKKKKKIKNSPHGSSGRVPFFSFLFFSFLFGPPSSPSRSGPSRPASPSHTHTHTHTVTVALGRVLIFFFCGVFCPPGKPLSLIDSWCFMLFFFFAVLSVCCVLSRGEVLNGPVKIRLG